MAEASDARLADERGGSARGVADRRQGPLRHRRGPYPGVQPYSGRLQAALRIDRHRESVARRRGDAGQAQHGRVRHGLVERDLLLRARRFALAAAELEPRQRARGGAEFRQARSADARRLVRRLCLRGRGAPLSRRYGERHRRLHPPARGLHRHRRHQADLWPVLALRHGRLRLVARSGGTACAHRARRRHHAAVDGRPRPEGFHLLADPRSRLRGRGRTLGQGHEDRRAEGISPRGHEQRDRRFVGARRRMASRRGRERRRRQPCRTRPTRCLLII